MPRATSIETTLDRRTVLRETVSIGIGMGGALLGYVVGSSRDTSQTRDTMAATDTQVADLREQLAATQLLLKGLTEERMDVGRILETLNQVVERQQADEVKTAKGLDAVAGFELKLEKRIVALEGR